MTVASPAEHVVAKVHVVPWYICAACLLEHEFVCPAFGARECLEASVGMLSSPAALSIKTFAACCVGIPMYWAVSSGSTHKSHKIIAQHSSNTNMAKVCWQTTRTDSPPAYMQPGTGTQHAWL